MRDEKDPDLTHRLRARVAEFPWWHSIDLGNGLVTPGRVPLPDCVSKAGLVFDRVNLSGLDVLDIGAFNGYYSFDAKRRGARKVLATDSYAWVNRDIRGREAFDLARTILGAQVDAREIDVADLSPETVGRFDVVLYLGVFYHRYDAIEALAKAAAVAKHLLVVETHLALRHLDVPAMEFYPGSEQANDPTNWWGPNEHLVTALLRGHGFHEIEVSANPFSPSRATFHAWRSTEARLRLLEDKDRLLPIAEFNEIAAQGRSAPHERAGKFLASMRRLLAPRK
jgi:tRNA (mo5U34)-methyltransferase